MHLWQQQDITAFDAAIWGPQLVIFTTEHVLDMQSLLMQCSLLWDNRQQLLRGALHEKVDLQQQLQQQLLLRGLSCCTCDAFDLRVVSSRWSLPVPRCSPVQLQQQGKRPHNLACETTTLITR